MTQRKPASAGWQRDSVTVPIISAMRMWSPSTVLNSHHEPTNRRVFHTYHFPRAGAVVRDNHTIAQAGAEPINRQKRLAIRFVIRIKSLHDQQPPSAHAGVFDRRDGITHYTSDLHGTAPV